MASASSTANAVLEFVADDHQIGSGNCLAILDVLTFDENGWGGEPVGDEAEERESVGDGKCLHGFV